MKVLTWKLPVRGLTDNREQDDQHEQNGKADDDDLPIPERHPPASRHVLSLPSAWSVDYLTGHRDGDYGACRELRGIALRRR